MNKQEKFECWIESAIDDLSIADTLIKGGHWLYVLFMCQQVIEKAVKGLYAFYVDDNIPHIHNIGAIAQKLENKIPVVINSEQYSFFEDLSKYYIKSRYNIYKRNLSVKLDAKKTKIMLKKTKEVFEWLLTLKQ
jgi:HEPN domain-containing protein